MRNLKSTLIAIGVLALRCVDTHLVLGDVISINNFQQQATLSSVVSLPSPSMSANKQYNTGSTIEKKEESAVATVGANKATAFASQFPVGSAFTFDPNQKLEFRFTNSSSGSIVNVTGNSDEARVFDLFRISFNIIGGNQLSYALIADVSTTGDLTATGQIQDANGMNSAVVVSLTSHSGPLFTRFSTDSATGPTSKVGTLGPGSYELVGNAAYRVSGTGIAAGTPTSGSATYSVNFSVSAVPEPSSLGVLASLGCLFSLRRRRSRCLG